MSPPPEMGWFLVSVGLAFIGWIVWNREDFKNPQPGDGAIVVMAFGVGLFAILIGLLMVGAAYE